jgi:hypothetical protein
LSTLKISCTLYINRYNINIEVQSIVKTRVFWHMLSHKLLGKAEYFKS